MGLFCCGGFGICCLVMKTLWANTFAVLISMVSPYPYTTAACLLPIIFYLVHRFLLPYISTFWSSKQTDTEKKGDTCCSPSGTDCGSSSSSLENKKNH